MHQRRQLNVLQVHDWLIQSPGVSEKTIACLMLYQMQRLDFAVPAVCLEFVERVTSGGRKCAAGVHQAGMVQGHWSRSC